MARLLKLPFLVILTALSGLVMLVPAAHAVRIGDFFTARAFLHSGVLILLLTTLIAVATFNRPPAQSARMQLIALLGGFVVLPVFLGLPLLVLTPQVSAFELYFEMLSCLTTTGASVFDHPSAISDPVHLWRGLVGWLGGFLMLLSAVAIFEPLNLGGFEVYAKAKQSGAARSIGQIKTAAVSARLTRFARNIFPPYLALTLALALALVLTGERPFIAAMLAMATLSTSGISATDMALGMPVGYGGEMVIFVFLMVALTRVLIPAEGGWQKSVRFWQDNEFKLAMALVATLPLLLFLRHWIASAETNAVQDVFASISALWGSVFTVLSFLTTTGFVSTSWHDTVLWSGLHNTGIMLIGLAVIGGGVATTAGGIKLLRVYALYKHGMRELQKLSYPSSVGGAGGAARYIRREGAYISWMFFMLFAVTTALVMLGLSLTGLNFEQSLSYGTAALSTTGPLAQAVLHDGGSYGGLNNWSKAILCAAMVMGRLETLAIIAVVNPDFWRR